MEQSAHDLALALADDVGAAFPRLVAAYQQRIFVFALRTYLPVRIAALDLPPWLLKIALNEFRHRLRATRLHLIPLDLAADGEPLDVADLDNPLPELVAMQRESHQELVAAIARLPELSRLAIVCFYFEQLSYQEIAALLDHPLGTIKSAIHRGVRLLRAQMQSPSMPHEEGESWQMIFTQRRA
jgi:RNA polymerase sigma-70 factor (ECF subfamily)